MKKRFSLSVFSLVLSTLSCFAGGFRAGGAVRDITPSADMLPLTRAPHVEMTGVLDSIHVRVIALADERETILIVSAETGRSLGPQFADSLRTRTGIPLQNILMTSTHTHAAPEITGPVDFAGADRQARWARYALQQMLSAADEALASLEPATMGIGYGESYVNVNRNAVFNRRGRDGSFSEIRDIGWNPSGPTDRTLAAIRFNAASDGHPIAFLVNYAVHGTVMHANTCLDGKTGISSDLPGFTSAYLEQNHPGATAIWLSGAAGDQNPIVQNDLYFRNPSDGTAKTISGSDYAILEWLSAIHYADVEEALGTISHEDSAVSLTTGFESTSIPGKDGGEVYLSLQYIRIGEVNLACFSGEMFSTTGEFLKENAARPNTLIVNHAWQRTEQDNGYHADDWTLLNGGFGQRQAKYLPGYLDKALLGLLHQLENQ